LRHSAPRSPAKRRFILTVIPLFLALVLLALLTVVLRLFNLLPRSNSNRTVSPKLHNKFLNNDPLIKHEKDTAADRIHIAMIFDENRYDFSLSVVRSLLYYSKDPVTLHLVSPKSLHESIADWPSDLPDTSVHIATHDYDRCVAPTSLISHIARDIHMSAMCKVFLAEIVPADNVLYIDTDVTVVSDIAHCWLQRKGTKIGTSFGNGGAVIGMGADMGEACQSFPDKCYPIGMRFRIPRGLECGTTPQRAKIVRAEGRKCQSVGEYEPFQFNGGVALMNLKRMRENMFTARFVQTSIYTWRTLGYRQARWGEQDLLNNYFRFYPQAVVSLPCGCNFQFSAARRESKCANQTVTIAHGWTRQLLNTRSHDRYNLHFNFFRRTDYDYSKKEELNPPRAAVRSKNAPDWTPPTLEEMGGRPLDVTYREHDASCSQQSHHCALDDIDHAQDVSIDILADTVNVLSRTSHRPRFFSEMAASVREQSHPAVNHIVGSDDPLSRMSYLDDIPRSNVVSLTTPTRHFDPNEVCRVCKSPTGRCGSAPSLEYPKARQRYLDCYCGTSYPMNSYMNELQQHAKPGWIVYVDDDNLFEHRFAVSELLASIKSRQSLVAFRAHLGRLTPSDKNFQREKIVMGDFDSSNFAFHTQNLAEATWSKHRCGDFRVAKKLSSVLPVEWVDHTFIQSNPLRAGLGGMGRRGDVGKPVITVVVTSYLSTGWRPSWVREIVDTYTAEDMQHLVAKVVLIWNNPSDEVPQNLVEAESERFVIMRQDRNSLNNRWIAALEHVDTDVVLNLDDDIYVKKEGLICMLNWFRKNPRRLVGPFVRRIEGTKYVIDELTDSSEYSVVLPRVMMVPTNLMKEYSSNKHTWFHEYIDSQEAHCDDVFLNLLAQQDATPLRVLLPERSLVDFYSKCWLVDSARTGGLALQKNRSTKSG